MNNPLSYIYAVIMGEYAILPTNISYLSKYTLLFNFSLN